MEHHVCFVIIPVKSLQMAKTRLSIILNSEERKALMLAMLKDVLKAIKSSIVSRIILISPDLAIKELANNFGVKYLLEKKKGLNEAIKQATEWCTQNNAESVLVLPADIPLITSEDINQIVKLGSNENCIVISPSQNGGTNALLRKPPNLMPTYFGPQSFMKHFNEALTKGITIKVYRSQRVAMDIDSLEDLRNFLKIENQTILYQFLKQIKIDTRLKI